jgi:hypothetical protein
MMWSCWSDRRGVGAAGRPGRPEGRSGGGGRSIRGGVGEHR